MNEKFKDKVIKKDKNLVNQIILDRRI